MDDGDSSDIDALCRARGWSRARLVLELRKAVRSRGVALPSDESLTRMIRQWASGRRAPSEVYVDLFTLVFGASSFAVPSGAGDGHALLAEHLDRAGSSLDAGVVDLFEQQTQTFRSLDRRLGAGHLLAQTEAHVQQMSDLLAYTLGGRSRAALAEALAEAAALAGWQALDLGRPHRSWVLHEKAKAAARDSGNPAVIAHVTAQQAFALVDLGRPREAVVQLTAARHEAGTRVPTVLRSWLRAAEAEALAAAGDEAAAYWSLDEAGRELESGADEELAYVFLDDVHLVRWRGHCLARLGSAEAVRDLTAALADLDASFTRARAGVLVDLALVHDGRGESEASSAYALQALQLADATTSVRQRNRLHHLVPHLGPRTA